MRDKWCLSCEFTEWLSSFFFFFETVSLLSALENSEMALRGAILTGTPCIIIRATQGPRPNWLMRNLYNRDNGAVYGPQRSQEPSLISTHDIGIQYNIVHHLNLMLLSFAFSPFWKCWRIGSFIYLVILIKSIKKWAIPPIKANNFIRSGGCYALFYHPFRKSMV